MNRQSIIHDLTLMLLSLTSWDEGRGGVSQQWAWKGYDFDVLDELQDEGLISGRHAAKSVALTNEGIQRASELLEQYGISLDPDPEEQRFFRLHLTFDFSHLFCTRTLLVPEHTTFEDFHTMIQACLNWMNYHLYDFKLTSNGEERYIAWPDYATGEDPRLEYALVGEEFCPWLNAATTYLDEFLPKTREFLYSYDYGDGWEIKVRLLNRGERFASDVPVCWEGAGDAPPEDVGGEGGFINFLDVTSDPSHEDYEWLYGWGEDQGFEHFSKTAINERLAHWQDWARADAGTMPPAAQIRAFGKVIAEPSHK